ncbi:hypothetical protein [Streptomyces sp. NPDC058612]|uniref:hypothetical protein n=1 Tax=Streptomyces sp. NPDC058612 TaxID=3346555 RepID=UPI00365576F4
MKDPPTAALRNQLGEPQMQHLYMEMITLGVILLGFIGLLIYQRHLQRQVDDLRAEVACARIEDVLNPAAATARQKTPGIPSPAAPRR